MNFSILIMVALLLTGCATRKFQTDDIVSSRGSLPQASRVSDVEFIKQKQNHCGPASLAMLMSHAKKKVDVDLLASQMYTPLKEGTFQTDLISAARRQGMMAMPVTSIESLLKEIAAGNPVLVFQNLGLKKLPKWHYAVATGYNLKKPEVILHSGPDKNLKMNMRVFEHTWALADYWGLVVLPPGKLSATAGELDHMQSAVGLEQIKKFDEAEQAYLSILERWPFSLSALIGMGNIRYEQMRFSEAVIYLTAASIKHPQSSIAWHNLALAQGAARLHREASESSKKAISLVGTDKASSFKESLKEYLR